ncbi:MAG: hypothetical protein RMI45_01785 [Ignisphaera sp.]|nr:hypothetical protein [Ignisphaera sp.]MDW8084960.1 hypothetical protein [Ignisphaera sp.]
MVADTSIPFMEMSVILINVVIDPITAPKASILFTAPPPENLHSYNDYVLL